jgi:hypothetical protein
MTEAKRVSPQEARRLMDNEGALLVAIYRGMNFERNRLDGAISYDEFEAMHLPALKPEQRVIFY